MAKALVALRGIGVEYTLLLGFRWSASVFAALGDEKSEAVADAVALRVLQSTNDKLKSVMVQRAIDGRISPRQPGINFGELGVALDMPAGTLSTSA